MAFNFARLLSAAANRGPTAHSCETCCHLRCPGIGAVCTKGVRDRPHTDVAADAVPGFSCLASHHFKR